MADGGECMQPSRPWLLLARKCYFSLPWFLCFDCTLLVNPLPLVWGLMPQEGVLISGLRVLWYSCLSLSNHCSPHLIGSVFPKKLPETLCLVYAKNCSPSSCPVQALLSFLKPGSPSLAWKRRKGRSQNCWQPALPSGLSTLKW